MIVNTYMKCVNQVFFCHIFFPQFTASAAVNIVLWYSIQMQQQDGLSNTLFTSLMSIAISGPSTEAVIICYKTQSQ